MSTIAEEGEVGMIELPKGGTMSGIACSPNDEVFVSQGPLIWKIDRDRMEVERYAGKAGSVECKEGHRLEGAKFHRARGLSITDLGFYVVDTDENRVCRIEDDYVSYFAGNGRSGYVDGPTLAAEFRSPCSVIVFQDLVLVSDTGNQKIRVIHPDGTVTSIGSSTGNDNGNFETAKFTNPCMLCVSPRNTILVTDGAMHLLREVDMTKREIWTIHLDVLESKPQSSLTDAVSGLSISEASKTLAKAPMEPRAVKQAKVSGSQVLHCPLGMVFDSDGYLYLANYSDHSIMKIDYDSNQVQTFVGGLSGRVNGKVEIACTKWPNYITLTQDGDMFWTEHMDSSVRYLRGAVLPSHFKAKDAFPSFADFLQDPPSQMPPDLLFPLPDPCPPLACHSHILASSIPIEAIDVNFFKNREIPTASAFQFIATLYGQKTFPPADRADTICSYGIAHKLVYDMQLDAKWGPIFDAKFLACLRPLTMSTLVEVFLGLATSVTVEAKCVQILAAWMASSRLDTEAKQRWRSNLAQNPSWRPEWIDMALGGTLIPITLRNLLVPQSCPFDIELRGYAEQLAWSDTEKVIHGPSHCPTNFIISNGEGKAIAVHDWLLFCRWPYFRRLIMSGLVESSERCMELSSSDFPSDVLLQFLRYLYYGIVSNEDRNIVVFAKEADCIWIIENGAQFDILDLSQATANPGFENLLNHCKQTLRHQLSRQKDNEDLAPAPTA